MTRDTEGMVRTFLSEECYLKEDEIKLDQALFSSGLLSSLDLIDLISFLETTFEIRVDDDETSIDHFDTPAKIISFINSKTA